MRKTSLKSKNVQAPKGCLKISSFFKKQSETVLNKTEKHISDIVTLDSDDDFINVPNEATTSKNNKKRNSPIIKKRKKPADGAMFSPVQKKCNINVKSPILASHSKRYGIVTTAEADSCIISLKSANDLLSPEDLKEHSTPEKIMEHYMVKLGNGTPKQLNFDIGKIDIEQRYTGNKNGEKTPKKVSPKQKEIGKKLKNSSTKTNEEDTPDKQKITPRKLFDKSPRNLNDFKVEVIENFVKITPSKSNKKIYEKELGKSSEKRQSSILKFISPSTSSKSLEVQMQNEKTPPKQISPGKSVTSSSALKVKTRLDFSDDKMLPKESRVIEQKTCQKSQEMFKGKMAVDVSERENDFNLSNIDFNFDDSWDVESQKINYSLDLTQSQYCKIMNINQAHTEIVLTVKSCSSHEHATCSLQGFWMHMTLSVGDTIHIAAKKLENSWIVDNENGLLVYEPDLLVSTTYVVNSLFCKRRSVLNVIFKGFEPANKQMVIGTLVHSLLQHVLKTKCQTQQEVEAAAKHLIYSRDTVRRAYECGITVQEVEKELATFIPNIVDFINVYVHNDRKLISSYNGDGDWKGKITTIDDIEENIWCPELGVKGKVDISIKSESNLMPLELKTGRATVSVEHRGQVILYIMMMNKLGYDVPSGLLLYLREGVLKEIPMSPAERRDIIILRNELAFYLTKQPKVHVSSSQKCLQPVKIPEPINHHSACYKCPYNVICTSYAKYTNEDISSFKELSNIQRETLSHLKDSHLEYFMRWISLIALESNLNVGSKDLREIYTLKPKEREKNGKCIINLKVSNIEPECNGILNHTFESINDEGSANFLASGIMESNYVVVSVDSRPAISSGFVVDVQAKSVTVALDRSLDKKYPGRTFHIDTYDSTSIQSYNSASLTLLLELSPKAEQLRRIIIDKQLPTFHLTLPKVVATKGKPILARLNKVQQRAVLKALVAKDYFLIKGMPGTGKTTTIVALIQLLVELEKSVIITSHTHSAVDTVCLKLVKFGVKLMRFGNESKIHENLKEYSEYNLTAHCKTPEELEEVYNSVQVFAVTCLGSGHPLFSKRTLDVCIVDESTQVLQCSVIRPLYAAKTFVLIGDPDQLPAVVKNKDAIDLGMSESLFERLHTEESTIALNLNYRMNRPITDLANFLTYKGELLIGSETVGNATLKLPNKQALISTYQNANWVLEALDECLEKSVRFIDTGPVWNLKHDVPWETHENAEEPNKKQNFANIYEAAIVFKLVKALLKAGVPNGDICVIATYRAQVVQLSALLSPEDIEISTVDRFQGKDRSVIVYSCSKSKDNTLASQSENKYDLLEDKRRLNVAITRAKHKIIIVGDLATLRLYSTFKEIMPVIEKNLIKIGDNESGIDWKSLLDLT